MCHFVEFVYAIITRLCGRQWWRFWICHCIISFNPFIFFRPVEYGIGSADNSLLGAGLKLTISQHFIAYSNFILDEFLLSELRNRTGWWGNKYGVQLGIKTFDLFNKTGLYSITEFNLVRPFTYSHISSKQNYGHKNHSLAHPLESNFKEYLFLNR